MVVFEQDPAAVTLLLGSGKGYVPPVRPFGPPEAMYVPHCFTAFVKASGLDLPTEPVLFLHQRVSPHGLVRVVIVQCDPDWNPELTLTNYFDNWAIEPCTFMKTPAAWELQSPILKMGPTGPRKPGDPCVRFFAGQADASDAAHFTIGYQITGGGGTIDGWLRDPGEIELKVRDGPPVDQGKFQAAVSAAEAEESKLDPLPPGITGEQQRAITVAAFEKAIATMPGNRAVPDILLRIAGMLDSPAVAPEEPDKALAIYKRLKREYPAFTFQAACGEANAYYIKNDIQHCRQSWQSVLDMQLPAGADPAAIKELEEGKSYARQFLAGLDHEQSIRAATSPTSQPR